jgi:hypothetical protein
LGAWGSSEAQAAYDALIAEWLASGRGRPKTDGGQTATDPTIVEVLVTYLDHAEKHYSAEPGERSSELMNMKEAIKPLRKLYGRTPARSFGPLALRAVRESMIKAGLARTTINARVNRIRRVFRWAACHRAL